MAENDKTPPQKVEECWAQRLLPTTPYLKTRTLNQQLQLQLPNYSVLDLIGSSTIQIQFINQHKNMWRKIWDL